MAISLYWTPTISAIRKAAAPMIGGMICPPVEAAASTAPANSPLYPVFFISGIVTEPVVTVFPTELPDTIPQRAEEITATLAGPPVEAPARELANWIKNSEIPVASRNAPNRINSAIYVEQTPMGVPMTPLVV